MSTATDIASIIHHVAKGGDPAEAIQAALACVATAKRSATWTAYGKAAKRLRACAKRLEDCGMKDMAIGFGAAANEVLEMVPKQGQRTGVDVVGG